MTRTRAIDRIGTTVNGFYIESVKRENNRTYAYVICPYCKEKKWMRMDSVKDKRVISCGCYNADNNFKKPKNIKDRKFFRLTAISPTEEKGYNGSIIWKCNCDCGNTVYVSESNLSRGHIKSCGCLATEVHSKYGKTIGNMVRDEFCIENTNIKNLTAKTPKNNTSGIKGVTYDKNRKKWIAQIMFKGKNYHLGRYYKKEDAAKVRKIAEEKIFGGFLRWYAEEFPEKYKKINKFKKENNGEK